MESQADLFHQLNFSKKEALLEGQADFCFPSVFADSDAFEIEVI